MKHVIELLCLIFLVLMNDATALGESGPSAPTIATPRVTVTVFDNAKVSTEQLAAAEEEARQIFLRAGVDITWLNCSKPLATEQSKAAPCGSIGVGHVVAEILPRANNEQLRFRLEVLGTANITNKRGSFYCFLFYDRIERLAGQRLLKSRLLANVLAHEIGHLILSSNSHSLSGIMSGQWDEGGLRQISQGAMFFQPSESRIMRQRLIGGSSASAIASTVGD
jgi:hypothetical protein